MGLTRDFLLLMFLTSWVLQSEAFYAYEPELRRQSFSSLRDELLKEQERKNQEQADIAAQMYFQDLLSPFLKRSYLEDNRLKKRSDEPQGCTERSGIRYTGPDTAELDVRFPAVRTKQDDTYLCTGFRVPFKGQESFVVKFTPHADMHQSHHMLVYGCREIEEETYWGPCYSPCRGKTTLYAWARNAPEMNMPEDVGYSIGGDTGINYVVVQMHFAEKSKERSCAGVTLQTTTVPQKYFAGILLLGSMSINLPPHTNNIPSSIACKNPVKEPIHVFAFRTHAHMLANVITGYRVRDQKYKMIGKGNPKWPQSFYPRVGGEIKLAPGDVVAAQCVYNNTKNRFITAGPSGSDEMCNLYLMFYSPSRKVSMQQLECWDFYNVREEDVEWPSDVMQLAPYPGYAGEDSRVAIADGTARVPAIPMEHEHHHHGGAMGGGEEDEAGEKDTQSEETEAVEQEQLERDFLQLQEIMGINTTRSRSHGMPETEGLVADMSWPHLEPKYKIGAVGGLVADKEGNVHVFHRADRIWDAHSFTSKNFFTEPDKPIDVDVIYHISKDTGRLLHAWGSGQFYMPHGISLDGDGNIWLTDVALQQVLKYPPEGADRPMIALGERFVPGSDNMHFCKPTDVAVDEAGMIYVSDGYCNGRVMKFAPDGTFIKKWGRMVVRKDLLHQAVPPGVFFIAHNIILCGPTSDELCVADRENGRIQCFTKDGKFLRILDDEKMGKRVFAITYSPVQGGVIYGVNGPDESGVEQGGFTIQYETGNVIERWQPAPEVTLTDPHDISASHSGHEVYVGDLSHKKVYKFKYVTSESPPVDAEDASLDSEPPSQNLDQETIERKSGTDPNTDGNLGETDADLESQMLENRDDGNPPDLQRTTKDGDMGLSPDAGGATTIIIILLLLPTVAILTAFVCVRIRARRLKEYEGLLSAKPKKKSSLNLGRFLNSSRPENKGFTRVNGASDGEDDESDVEVYTRNEDAGQPGEDEGVKE